MKNDYKFLSKSNTEECNSIKKELANFPVKFQTNYFRNNICINYIENSCFITKYQSVKESLFNTFVINKTNSVNKSKINLRGIFSKVLVFLFNLHLFAAVNAQSFVIPTSGNSVNNQLPPLVANDGVTLQTSMRSTGCVPGPGSNLQFNTQHVSTGAIYRNSSWAAGCKGSRDIFVFDFTSVLIRPLGLKFSIYDVDNGSDSVSVQIYSNGLLVDYSYTLYSPTYVTANGASPNYGFNGSGNNNSTQDDNTGRIDIACINPIIHVDSVVIYKENNRNVAGNPSQSIAAFQWNQFIILPLKLVSFTAVTLNNEVEFNWLVKEATQISHYEFEYSIDGINFQQTGEKISAKGNYSNEVSYSYKMQIPVQNDIIYFRLVSKGEHGEKYYSNIIKTGIDNKLKAIVYPTLFKNYITVKIESKGVVKGYIALIGMDGKIYQQQITTLKKGNNHINITLPDMLPGAIYSVIGKYDNGSNFSQTIVKQ